MAMLTTDTGLLARFDAFVKKLSSKDFLAIFHDADTDGISSAAILATAVQRIRGRLPDIELFPVGRSHAMRPGDIADMKKAGVTKFISCDVSLDNEPSQAEAIAKFADVCVIDHHALYEPFKAKNIILLKPQLYTNLEKPSRYCTSKMVYDLFSRHVDISDKDWLAVAGSISDIAHEPWMDWIKTVFKKYDVPMKKDLFKTKLGEVGIYINDAASYDRALVPKAYHVAIEAKLPTDILKSPLQKYHAYIDAEIQKWTKQIKNKGEWHPELRLVFYYVTPKYAVKSAITTILGLKYPDWIVILYAQENGIMSISARDQRGHIAMNNLMVEALKGLPDASGGGHIPAAGGRCRVEDYAKFKDNVMKLLRSGFTGLDKK
jgi:oligoribonuclease NrnB/cAMP/cGMP phosphodiesterase (DHH superfamily)